MRIIRSIIVTIIAFIIIVFPIVAATLYSAKITVNNTSVTSYAMLPITTMMDNGALVDGHYITAANVNVDVTLNGNVIPSMVADDRTLFAMPTDDNTSSSPYYNIISTGATAPYVIVGYGGHLDIADNAAVHWTTDHWLIYLYDAYLFKSVNGIIFEKPGAIVIKMQGGSLVATIEDVIAGTQTLTITDTFDEFGTISLGYQDYAAPLVHGMVLSWQPGNIGAVITDNIASITLDVVNNANPVAMFSNAIPYISGIQFIINPGAATAASDYRGTNMVIGTTLVDNDITGVDATITWGTNPASVTATVSSLGAPATGAPATTTVASLGVAPGSSDPISGSPVLVASPFYPLLSAIENASGGDLTTDFQAIMFSMFFAVGGAIVAGVATQGRSFFLVVLGTFIGAAAGYALKFYQDIWILYVLGLLAIAALFLDARKSW
jgi:hypothetical protein